MLQVTFPTGSVQVKANKWTTNSGRLVLMQNATIVAEVTSWVMVCDPLNLIPESGEPGPSGATG